MRELPILFSAQMVRAARDRGKMVASSQRAVYCAQIATMTTTDHDPQIVQALDRVEADLPEVVARR